MTATLPTITYKLFKKNCSDCNRGTHLEWKRTKGDLGPTGYVWPIDFKWRLCQGCARRRGGQYSTAILEFVREES